MRLDGKVALITGASHGIGEGIAVAFAEAGADVVLAARTVSDLERVSRRVESLGRKALVVPTDVSDLSAIQSMVDATVDSMGSIDVLANVAGSVRRVPILEASADDWEFTTHVQQRSVYFASQAVARVMIEQGRGGKMLNIASMTSYRGYHGISLYGAAKAAVIQMTKNMAVEWASYDIQVNAIAPGWIETPMTATIAPSRRRWIEERTLQGKFGVVEDLSAMAVLLCSPAGGFITGQTIPIDGGFLAGHPWPTGD
jgi:2-deoxy-D-gluconate 3-dehydrogenase